MSDQAPPGRISEEWLREIEEMLVVLATSNSPDIVGVMDALHDDAVPAMIKWIRAHGDVPEAMSDGEGRLTTARLEWALVKRADDLQRSAWGELHAGWLLARTERLETVLKLVLDSVHAWRHAIPIVSVHHDCLKARTVLKEGQ